MTVNQVFLINQLQLTGLPKIREWPPFLAVDNEIKTGSTVAPMKLIEGQ